MFETAGAPTFYFPPEDVETGMLTREGPSSVCEWKGVAVSFSVGRLAAACWCYEDTFPEFDALAGWFAFHPAHLRCFVGDERVSAQPGGYYGGWVTSNLRGPIKGLPGSGGW